MNREHPQNGGKFKGFEGVGYDVSTLASRDTAAKDVVEKLTAILAVGTWDVKEQEGDQYGRSFLGSCEIAGPKGTKARLVTTWELKPGSDRPRLTTNWLEVYRD